MSDPYDTLHRNMGGVGRVKLSDPNARTKRTTPDNITDLKPNQIIIVGTNAAGIHAGGAAAQAYRDFGALMGCAEGTIGGQSYGIVTLYADLTRVPSGYLQYQVEHLIAVATANPTTEFLLTKVGCGIAGFNEDYMKQFFKDTPHNVVKPTGW